MGWASAALEVLGEAPPRAEAWLSLAEPTPRSGPLRHDWLLPGGKPQLALNVFCHDEALVEPFAAAVERTASDLGVAREAAELLALPVRWHGGIAMIAGRPRLKLYATQELDAGLAALARTLDLKLAPDTLSIGVDLVESGLTRPRSYRPYTTDATWPHAPTWGRLPVPGLSHRLLAILEGPPEKRSYDAIFGPEAELDALFALERAATDLDPSLPRCLEPDRLGRLAAVAARFGLVVRPVSLEIDRFPDHLATDALVTLALP